MNQTILQVKHCGRGLWEKTDLILSCQRQFSLDITHTDRSYYHQLRMSYGSTTVATVADTLQLTRDCVPLKLIQFGVLRQAGSLMCSSLIYE